ncbi:MAG: hypothetical protein RR824_08225 [Clostridia bacterium]
MKTPWGDIPFVERVPVVHEQDGNAMKPSVDKPVCEGDGEEKQETSAEGYEATYCDGSLKNECW